MPIPYLVKEILLFLVSWLVSAVIIHLVVNWMEERKWGFGTAMATSLVGAIVFTVFHMILSSLGTILGVLAWLWILRTMYDISWGKAIAVAILVYIISAVLGLIGIPTLL